MQRRILGEIQNTFIPSSIRREPSAEELLDQLRRHTQFIDIEAGYFEDYPIEHWDELIDHIRGRMRDMDKIMYRFEYENQNPDDMTVEAADILNRAVDAYNYVFQELVRRMEQIGVRRRMEQFRRNVRRRAH